jgi:hypothetical protein
MYRIIVRITSLDIGYGRPRLSVRGHAGSYRAVARTNPKVEPQPPKEQCDYAVKLEDGRLAYGVEEFARRVGVGKSSIFEEIRLRRLRSVFRCGRRLILHEDGMEWLRAGYATT